MFLKSKGSRPLKVDKVVKHKMLLVETAPDIPDVDLIQIEMGWFQKLQYF
jgi:hypothetical protein